MHPARLSDLMLTRARTRRLTTRGRCGLPSPLPPPPPPPARHVLCPEISVNEINSRGTFLMTKACLPHMTANNFGRVINMSPPISTSEGVFKGRTAYNMSKMGMTMVALGVADEYRGSNITGNSLWPATIIGECDVVHVKLEWCTLCTVTAQQCRMRMQRDPPAHTYTQQHQQHTHAPPPPLPPLRRTRA
jgi:hypothetical protein